jgi:hypothetical protein
VKKIGDGGPNELVMVIHFENRVAMRPASNLPHAI